MPADDLDNKKARRIAFVVITLVFIISIAAMIYWAVNVAAARISSGFTVHLQALTLLPTTPSNDVNQPTGTIFSPRG